MTERYSLTGGMNEVIPGELLPDATAQLIQNMRIQDDGSWQAVKVPEAQDDVQFETKHTYSWKPVYMPADAGPGEDTVYVYFADGAVTLHYRDRIGDMQYKELLPIYSLAMDNVRCSYDAQQFVFVDGREGRGAQRITINSEGEVSCRKFGTDQPIMAPVINQIENSKYEDGKYTGMPVGSILFYAYCVVNEYGERSNPSPTVVCDTAQWQAKGELLVGDYVYSEQNGGSIKSVSLTCEIPVPDDAKRIELYRAHAEYFESFKPIDPMRLVKSMELPNATRTVKITDTSFASPIDIDYENDTAPAGDDIVLESGTLFIANAVSDRTFAYPVEQVWRITLTNANLLNYVNRWISIDIRDENHIVDADDLNYFANLSQAGALTRFNRYRFIDTDMITPLNAYMAYNQYGNGALTQIDGTTVLYGALTHIQVPYIPANSEKTIYLVKFSASCEGYGQDATLIDPDNAASVRAYYDGLINNPVRDDKAIIAEATTEGNVRIVDGWDNDYSNRANGVFIDTNDTPTIYYGARQHFIPDEYTGNAVNSAKRKIRLLDEDETLPSESYSKLYEAVDGMIPGNSGYAYGWIVSREQVANELIAQIYFSDGYDNNTRYLRARLSRMVYSGNPGTEWAYFKVGVNSTNGAHGSDVIAYVGYPNPGASNYMDYFFYIGWDKTREPAADDILTDITVGLIARTNDGRIYCTTKDGRRPRLTWGGAPRVNFKQGQYHAIDYCYVNIGEYINDVNQIIALARFGTHFPTEPIGYRGGKSADYVTVGQANYVRNRNIAIEEYLLINEKKPGKIRWSKGGSMPELYERNVFEEIQRIRPVKSFQPTDEHNTILIWTQNKVLRMALGGDNNEASSLITELQGVGLQDRDALVATTEGVIWRERSGIYYLSQAGTKDIGSQWIRARDFDLIYDSRNQEVLCVDAGGNAYVYNLKWGVWSKCNYGIKARAFIEYNGKWCLVSDSGVYDLNPTDDTTLSPLIITKKHSAKQKLRRLTLHSAGGQVSAIIYNHRLAGGYVGTPTYTLTGDTPLAIPQLSGDHVEFNIVTDNINYYEIEAADGR